MAAAHARGGQDNASALVAHVVAVGEADAPLTEAHHLPLPGRLQPGARLDGFIVETELHSSHDSLIYRARHAETGQRWALKTLQPVLQGDAAAACRLLAEEWFLKRAGSWRWQEDLVRYQTEVRKHAIGRLKPRAS